MAALSSTDLEWIERYMAHVRVEKRLAERSLVLYRLHLDDLGQRCGAQGLGVLEVQEAHVRRWAAQLHASGRQPRGIALVLSCWRAFYTWLGRQGVLTRHPVQGVRPPKAGTPLPKALAVEDAVRLAEARADDVDPLLAARDRCMVELWYGGGLRMAELLCLDVSPQPAGRGWIDAEAGEAHVLGKGGKWRTVPLGRPALEALQQWQTARQAWAGDDPALFIGRAGVRLSPQALRERLRQQAIRAGLPTHVHPHMLRHSYASHLLQSSGDLRAVQELLGHAHISTTQIYTRLDFQHLAKVYEAAHPRAGRRRD